MATRELSGHPAIPTSSEAPPADTATLTAQRDGVLGELRRLEWIFQTSPEYDRPWRVCPRCRGIHPADGGRGHAPDCSLAAQLASAEWF